ncbi:TatD family hydrolase [Acidiferrimicrobium sp. IK]|uniref:TatD family hydrolase n=1 Tax=Acidiferrimicrobium sp. IK TaxID=2871700 RepID=UPI0021CB6598|nr:TatD family hydrolase [Acidiferrimicrobium sp. IK]MCU4185442.1 TatD family hydrolase [Acidiferrimicrobium sp. IK]
MWTDSHCHVPYEGLDATEDELVAQAHAAGVDRMITVGTDAAQSAAAIDAARRHPRMWATVGLHPHDASQGVATIEGLLADPDPLVVAVGECGLDYFYEHSPRDAQRSAFAAQIGLARDRDLALVIHTRDAWDDTFDILASEGVPERTVVHCFTGGPEEARRALDLGAWLSFSGIITFKTAGAVRDAAALCPLERMLVETDAPFLAPVPHRGKPNRPALVPVVGAAVAAARGVGVDEVEAATAAAATAVFRLPGA